MKQPEIDQRFHYLVDEPSASRVGEARLIVSESLAIVTLNRRNDAQI